MATTPERPSFRPKASGNTDHDVHEQPSGEFEQLLPGVAESNVMVRHHERMNALLTPLSEQQRSQPATRNGFQGILNEMIEELGWADSPAEPLVRCVFEVEFGMLTPASREVLKDLQRRRQQK